MTSRPLQNTLALGLALSVLPLEGCVPKGGPSMTDSAPDVETGMGETRDTAGTEWPALVCPSWIGGPSMGLNDPPGIQFDSRMPVFGFFDHVSTRLNVTVDDHFRVFVVSGFNILDFFVGSSSELFITCTEEGAFLMQEEAAEWSRTSGAIDALTSSVIIEYEPWILLIPADLEVGTTWEIDSQRVTTLRSGEVEVDRITETRQVTAIETVLLFGDEPWPAVRIESSTGQRWWYGEDVGLIGMDGLSAVEWSLDWPGVRSAPDAHASPFAPRTPADPTHLSAPTPPTPEVEDPADPTCPAYSGFSAVGTVWDYTMALPGIEGWERAQLVSLDAETGLVSLEIDGVYRGGGWSFSFQRVERYQCTATQVLLLGTDIEGTVTDGVTTVPMDSSGTWDPGMSILEVDAVDGVPVSSWESSATRTVTWTDGRTGTHDYLDYPFETGAFETLSLLGTTVEAVTVQVDLYSSTSSTRDAYFVPWIWWSPDLGMVKRGGLTLDAYALGTGVVMD